MSKRYYLIAQYFPGKGQTAENPECLFGTGSYAVSFPPRGIKETCCYISKKRAENYAAKCNGFYRYSRFAVCDVTDMI